MGRDLNAARDALRGLESVPIHGPNMEASRLTVRAGIAALEGRHDEALGAYREALRLWRDLGLVWDEAQCGLDVAMLMGIQDDEVLATVERTRNLLTQLGARPFLARLEAVLGPESPMKATGRDATPESEDVYA